MTFTLVATDPSWTDIAGLWVSGAGAFASTVIAVVAVVLSVSTARAQRRRDQRGDRFSWAHDYSVWLDAGTVYMAVGMDVAIKLDRDWVERGTDLQTRARLLDSPGAQDYMLDARAAFAHIEKLSTEKQVDAAIFATNLLKFWIEGWVSDPNKKHGDIIEWLSNLSDSGDGAAAT